MIPFYVSGFNDVSIDLREIKHTSTLSSSKRNTARSHERYVSTNICAATVVLGTYNEWT